MNFKQYFDEAKSRKTLIIVDVQPEYLGDVGHPNFELSKFFLWLNKVAKTMKIVILFNGPDLGMPSQEELHQWYIEHGLNENINLTFFDKGYAFFRYCMDEGIDEDDIVNIVKFMKDKNINDSRDLTTSGLWDEFVKKYDNTELRELLEFSGDCIHIPDLMNFLNTLGNNFVLVGGAKNECLKEVEIALKANNQTYEILNQWVY